MIYTDLLINNNKPNLDNRVLFSIQYENVLQLTTLYILNDLIEIICKMIWIVLNSIMVSIIVYYNK